MGKIPKNIAIAVSGGVDSMVCLEFLMKSKRDILVLHFNHNTENSDLYEEFVKNYCIENNVKYKIGRINNDIPKKRSKEDFWRECRYNFFLNSKDNRNVITCHHLDDAIETWIFSSLNGCPKLIPYKRDYIIRPFLINKKETIANWAAKNNTEYIQDKSNFENSFSRNYIRNVMMKDVLHINPGIHKNIKKKIIKRWRNYVQI